MIIQSSQITTKIISVAKMIISTTKVLWCFGFLLEVGSEESNWVRMDLGAFLQTVSGCGW
jgi:hypothetical protein